MLRVQRSCERENREGLEANRGVASATPRLLPPSTAQPRISEAGIREERGVGKRAQEREEVCAFLRRGLEAVHETWMDIGPVLTANRI